MVHCLSRRHREIVSPTAHQEAAQPLAAQDGKWDKEGGLVEPVGRQINNSNISTKTTENTDL